MIENFLGIITKDFKDRLRKFFPKSLKPNYSRIPTKILPYS